MWMRRLRYYGLALVFVAAAAMLRWAMPGVLGLTPFLAFYLAWVGAAAFGGLGPGLLATVASWMWAELFFDFTPGVSVFDDPTAPGRLAVVLVGGLIVSLVAGRMRQGRMRERGQMRELADLTQALREAKDGLEMRVAERTTDLRQAVELVEKERQRFQKVLDQLPAYLVLLTPDYRVPFANRYFEQRFGKCEGRRCYEYLFHRTRPCENCEAYNVLKTNLPQHWEWIGPDGRNYEIHDFPFADVDGSPLVMEVGLDITERKQAEAELAKHREHLEELVQERTGQLQAANLQLHVQAEELATLAEELRAQAEQLHTANEVLRKREQALHDAEERLHLAMESGKVGVWEWEAGTENMEWSQGIYALFGYPPGAVKPTRTAFRQRIHPQDLGRENQALNDSLETGKDYVCEFRAVWPDGSIHWIEARGQYVPVKNESGVTPRMRGALSDIDARKQAEEALHQSEARLQLAQQAGRVGVFDRDLQDNTTFWTPELEELFGLPAGSFEGKSEDWAKRVYPEDLPRMLSFLQEWQQSERTEATWEYRFVRPDGQVRWMEGRGRIFRDPDGKPLRVIGTNMDITERKEAEEALRTSEQRYRKLFEATVAGAYVTRPDGTFLDFNDALMRMLGYDSREELFQRRSTEFYADPVVRAELLRRLQKDGIVPITEAVLRRKDGSTFYAFGSAVLLTDERTGEFYILGVAIDINERKKAEEALRELTATLESKVAQRTEELNRRAEQLQKLTLDMSETEDRERKRMAAILHDDLQQQIAGAKFHLALLRNRAKYDASLQALGAQIDQMLKDAIDKSRSLSHELSPTVLHHADFADTLRWLASEVKAKHGLAVHVHARDKIHSQSDALKGFLYKAAQELLFNIVKHAGVKEAEIRVRQCHRYICLSISDRGRGFDPQALREATGYGLLSIREQIELLGGRMKIKSAKGKGSTFHIVVPEGEIAGTNSEGKTRPNGRAKAAGKDKGQLRVLLADDHEIVREGLRSLLSDEHDVEIVGEAANGREAVDLASQLKPDVIIMDMSMPVIEGDEATRQIKAYLPDTRVIAISMYDQAEKIEAMYQAGAERYVLKTAPSEELLAAIRDQAHAGVG